MAILVTGATANIGRKVVDHLLARGATDIRALTVDPRKAALPAGVEVVEGSLRRPDTLAPAFADVKRMYLAPMPDTAAEALALARAAGVRQVVDLSGEPESWWGSVGMAVEASGLAWTHLWPADFMSPVGSVTSPSTARPVPSVASGMPGLLGAPLRRDDAGPAAVSHS